MNAQRRTARRAAVGLAVAAALATTACGAGQLAETAQEKTTVDGTNVNVGQIALRGLAIETPDATTYPVGSSMQIVLVIVNDSTRDDKLLKISSSAASGWGSYASAADLTAATTTTATTAPTTSSATTSLTPGATPSATSTAPSATTAAADAPVSIARGVAVSYGVPAADGHVLALLNTTSVINPGTTIPITFTFQYAGTKTVPVPVRLSDEGSFSPSPSFLPTGSAGSGS